MKKLKVDNRDPSDVEHWFPGFDVDCDVLTYDKGWIKQLWTDLEKEVESGKTKAIGVSNFSVSKIEEILKFCKIPPAMNQIEIHPACAQFEVVDWCKAHNIQVTAYSPLGSGDRPERFVKEGNPVPLKDPVVNEIAKAHNKTAAQVIIRWDVQRGICVVPKSVHKNRILENFNVFDFELTKEEMDKINKLDRGERLFTGYHFFDNDADRDSLWK